MWDIGGNMPTGYTAEITSEKGISFKDFVMNCARAFGACVTMRDDPNDKEIPIFKVSDYHPEELRKAEKELTKFKKLTEKDWGKKAKQKFDSEIKDYEKRTKEYESSKDKYDKMLVNVKNWTPPTKDHTEFNYTKGFIELQSQVEQSEKKTEYTDFGGDISSKKTLIHYNTYTIDEVANKIVNELKVRNWEGKILKLPTGDYSKEKLPPKDEITKIIRSSMDKIGVKGDRLVEKNRNKILNSFNTLLRKAGKTVVYQKNAQKPYIVSTKEINRESMAVGNLRNRSATVFYSSDYKTELDEKNLELLNTIINDESLPKSSEKERNRFLLKTPIDLVFTKGEPERKFIKELCETENAKKIESWLKSRDMNFYSIEYSITSIGGKHSKIQSFNPDFFIKLDNGKIKHFVIIEIKSDGDVSDENKAKLKYGVQHFKDLNKELEKLKINEKYHFHFLSPNSYDVFFDHLRKGILKEFDFRSDLEDQLLAKAD